MAAKKKKVRKKFKRTRRGVGPVSLKRDFINAMAAGSGAIRMHATIEQGRYAIEFDTEEDDNA